MPGNHALLGPSGASRWLACPPSARLEEKFDDTTSEAASEGTLAHKLCEVMLQHEIGILSKFDYTVALGEITSDRQYKPEMAEYCADFAAFVMESYAQAQNESAGALIFLEQVYDLERWIPGGYGTCDISILAARKLRVKDFKYGKGVVVDATENKQMMLYALGAVEKYGFLYDIDTVEMVIYQPRVNNYSTYEMSVADLLTWAENELRPRAVLAYAGEGDFNPGDHCGFCKARATCRALADYQLEIAKHDFEIPELLGDYDIADILSRAPMFGKWLKSVTDYALAQAVHKAKKWPGFKLVEGRSNRVISDAAEVADRLIQAGYERAKIYKPATLLGITDLEGVVGKKKLGALIDDVIVKPPGKLALVPAADKRPEVNNLDAARRDFEGYGSDENTED